MSLNNAGKLSVLQGVAERLYLVKLNGNYNVTDFTYKPPYIEAGTNAGVLQITCLIPNGVTNVTSLALFDRWSQISNATFVSQPVTGKRLKYKLKVGVTDG